MLRASAIADDVREATGWRSVVKTSELIGLGWSGSRRVSGFMPCVAFPVRGAASNGEVDYAGLRLDEPSIEPTTGKVRRYEMPPGSKARLDVHPWQFELLGDVLVRLWLVEGAKKRDAMVSRGAFAISIPGVWNFKGRAAIADMDAIEWKGREVVVAFDSDLRRKTGVRGAARRLGALLDAKGARVGYLELEDDGIEKVGVDDFLAAGHAVTELVDRIRETVPRAASTEDGAELLAEVTGLLRRYVVWRDAELHPVAVALWIVHTHAIDAFDTTPRLMLRSAEKRSGKSRVFEVMQPLAARCRLAANVSVASMYRLAFVRPTFLLDEADEQLDPTRKDTQELTAFVNAGYRRGQKAVRCVGEGAAMEVKEFDTFCPVALASIGRLRDTIMDRCLIVPMRRRAPSEPVTSFRRRRVEPVAARLRERLTDWAAAAEEDLEAADPVMPEAVTDRAADLWEPLLAIADAAGGPWPELARRAAVAISGRPDVDTLSLGEQLLTDIRDLFAERPFLTRYPSSELLEALVALPASPWGDLHGRPLSSRRLATLLRPYDLHPIRDRVGSYWAPGDFADTFTRYLPPLDDDVADAISQIDPDLSHNLPQSAESDLGVTDVTGVAALGEGRATTLTDGFLAWDTDDDEHTHRPPELLPHPSHLPQRDQKNEGRDSSADLRDTAPHEPELPPGTVRVSCPSCGTATVVLAASAEATNPSPCARCAPADWDARR